MNKRQKEVIQAQLDSEKAVLKQLEKQYQTALNDIDRKIRILQSDEMTQSKIYRLEYQKALKKQVEAILEKLHGDEYSTIQEYLSSSYTDAFVGTMYDLAGQGVPLIMPIDQAAAVKAIMTDSKVSEGLYSALGVDITTLKKSISAEVTRGIASGMSYQDIARNISNVSGAPLSRAKTITRTEGHRIQQASTRDAQLVAKSKGADVVKQWDATLDGKTRDSHRIVDGEIREIDKKFSNGLEYPGDPKGKAAEVVNCRCVSLTRAKWALDADELKTLQDRAAYFGLDKTKNFADFKEKYIAAAKKEDYNVSNSSDSSVFDGIIGKQIGMSKAYQDTLNQKYAKGTVEAQKAFNKYVPSDSVANAAFTGTAHFDRTTKKVNMNFAADLQNKRGAGTTFFHEHGHYIDFMAAGSANAAYLSVNNQTFGALLQSDFKDYVKAYKKQHNLNAADAYRSISLDLLGHEKHSLSDLMDGISKGKCSGMYGHKRAYWTYAGALEKEAFAHMYEAMFDSDKYALMKQYFPNALAEFESMLKGVI